MKQKTLWRDSEAHGSHCGCGDLLGSIHVIKNQWWVVVSQSRSRLTMKRADSEMQAIRLKLGNTQCEMKARLNISQSYYSKIESAILPCPPEMIEAMRAMLPNLF